MMNPRLTRKRILAEIRFECGMRLKVWPMADRKNRRFLKIEHQIRFEQLVHLGELISTMTDQEYKHYADRIEMNRKKIAESKTVVRDLFTTNQNHGKQEAS